MRKKEAERLLAFSAKYINELEKIIFEQTQEPERSGGRIDCDICMEHHLNHHQPEKELEVCEHEWCHKDCSFNDRKCVKCGIYFLEKPAKKECEQCGTKLKNDVCPKCELMPNRDELAERLKPIYTKELGHICNHLAMNAHEANYYQVSDENVKRIADEARKYFKEKYNVGE